MELDTRKIEKAKLEMPKLKDITIGPKDTTKKKWVKQARLLPQRLRDSLKVKITIHSVDQEDWPVTSVLNDIREEIPRDTETEVSLPIFIHLDSLRKWQRVNREDKKTGKIVKKNELVPVYFIDIEDNRKVLEAIESYIREVG